MTQALQSKIEYSINLIKKAENIALQYSNNGFRLAFSGGKDSQVLYELAKMAGVKFVAEMQVTTVDPPELMAFVRKHYPEVKLNRPKLNMFDLIRKKKCLPRQKIRYCCYHLKELSGAGTVTLLGIRAAESYRRKKRNEFEISSNKFSGTIDQFNNDKEKLITCVKGRDKILLSPIFHWSDYDVWNFIKELKLPYCELYDKGQTRIGCMFCPMASPKQKRKDLINYPNVAKAYKKAIQYCIDNYGYCKDYSSDANEIFDCWISNKGFKSIPYTRLQTKINFENQ
jgi:phosphoadenosine phosphosulfate reductase